ncbi:2-oxo acid dehydrogenase subunit E2 [Candidatus Vidania fulgoroideorum]
MKKIKVKVPNFSEEKTEAKIIEIKKKNNVFVKEKEIILKIETEKIIINIISPCKGYFIKKKKVGDKVFPGETVAYINNIKSEISRENKIFREDSTATTFNDVDLTEALNLKDKLCKFNKIGLTSFFVKASAIMLSKFPIIRSSKKRNININTAVVTKYDYFFTPLIKNCLKKSIYEISKKIKKSYLKKKNFKNEIGDFTLSNGGVYGSLMSIPIINLNQRAIIGTHNVQDKIVLLDNELKVKKNMYVSMTYNHKYVRGKDAILALICFKKTLENPLLLL